MKTVAFVPIRLNNERLPGKNLVDLGGFPLASYVLKSLIKVSEIDEVHVYCSDSSFSLDVDNVMYTSRDVCLNDNATKGLAIYHAFAKDVWADVYVLVHATSPFLKTSTIQKGVQAVKDGSHDSAFTVRRFQTFAWHMNKPLNYALNDIPRTQDISSVHIETSGLYVYRREVLESNRRIGDNPLLIEVGEIEGIDIDHAHDLDFARLVQHASL